MSDIVSTVLEKYQVRKTRAQKDAFIALLQAHYPELQLQQGGLVKNKNLILGDVASAKIIFGAHYDTCAKLPFPNFIAPKNLLLTIGYSLLITLPFFLAVAVINVLLNFVTDDFWLHYFLSLGGFILLFFGTFFAGKANGHTANDNTSGVAALLQLYEALDDRQRAQVALVFFDNEENGLLGSSFFRKQYGKALQAKLMVNLDCISDGDHLLVVANKAARKRYGDVLAAAFGDAGEGKQFCHEKAEAAYYPSDQQGFKHAVALAAMHKSRFVGYWLARIHTDKDTVFDRRNIDAYVQGCKKLTESLAK
ncbi:MAG: M28 family peptidase [Oscillospiraceae bacterium]|nr:M28 family peptidase [Oscillospiraceae bacterium]